jgi:hypothetical protein
MLPQTLGQLDKAARLPHPLLADPILVPQRQPRPLKAVARQRAEAKEARAVARDGGKVEEAGREADAGADEAQAAEAASAKTVRSSGSCCRINRWSRCRWELG